ncbi:MAG: neutral/alkaline non-lysosomal ceramidase N-terminal domain-containing protein [Patescibacteria group bacterium]|nr:neutral/alkaline non-lysosomal ceramidase N-terminal domain-containing protein [Patescibacteria group bacterium]
MTESSTTAVLTSRRQFLQQAAAGMALPLAAGHMVTGQLATAAAGPNENPASKKPLMAGVATSNITPRLGGGIVGNFGTPPAAEYIHDELHARCFVLDDGESRLVLVIIDNIYVSREVLDEAKRQIAEATGIPADRMLMSGTHTHSSVSARWPNPLQPEKEFSEYQQFLIHRIADGVRCAIQNLQPARIAWGAADLPEQVFCRRWLLQPGAELFNPFGEPDQAKMNPGNRPDLLKPAGPVDPQIGFLALETAGGRPMGLLANYSLHYVGGVPRNHISADYFGVFADRIQQLLSADRQSPPFVGAMSNGTSGNINNNDYSKTREKREPYEQIQRVADQCAQAVYQQYKALRWHDWVPLSMQQRELELAVRRPTPAQLEHARMVLADPDRPDKYPHERSYANRAIQQLEASDTVSILLQALRIGDLGISAIPFEVFSETGLELKARNPFKQSFTIELANGGYGYLPTPEQHALGGYETWLGTSKVEVQASVKIVDALLTMFAAQS